MSITEQILQECAEIFEAELSLIRKYDDLTKEVMPSGTPETMLVAEFKSNTRSLNKIRKGRNSKEFARAWRYAEADFTPVNITDEPRRNSKKDVFYKETYVRFACSQEKGVLYLNFFYAPRYVKGWEFPIIETEKGLQLGESCLKWLF